MSGSCTVRRDDATMQAIAVALSPYECHHHHEDGAIKCRPVYDTPEFKFEPLCSRHADDQVGCGKVALQADQAIPLCTFVPSNK